MVFHSLRILVITLLCLGIAVIGTSAHADLDRSDPEAGSSVDRAPAQIEMWFSEELADGSTAQVLGPDGSRVDNDDAAIDLFDPDRKHLVVTLEAGLPAGEYTVEWTTVSGEDDDTHTGSFSFTVTVGAAPVASPVASPQASPVASPEASPDADSASTHTFAQVQLSEDPAGPDLTALGIALGVGLLATVGIYLFWLLVKPRK
ncbi:MAG: copper resistance protein CopC [Thermomicrobiales bacterium]|nr:copper resistance protein CopC [Thermomicrobiales bacterium]